MASLQASIDNLPSIDNIPESKMLSSPFTLEIRVAATRASKTGLQTYTHVMHCEELTAQMKWGDVRAKMLGEWDGPGEAAEIFRDGVFASAGTLNCPLVYLEHYPIGESELKSKTTLFFLPTYDTFKLSLEHKICIAPPELSHNMGYRQLVEPLCCNYRFYEQVLLWLQSGSVKRIGKYDIDHKGGASGPAVRHTIARLDVALKMTAVLGGEGPVLNFEPTIEFAYDKKSSDPYAVARDKLQAVSDDWIAHPWRYPLDVSLATKLVLTNESPTSAWHDAGVIAFRSVATDLMVPGGVLIVTAEDSGEKTPAYRTGEEGWHFSGAMTIDQSKYSGINVLSIGVTFKKAIGKWGMQYKTSACGEWSAGGYEVNLNEPASLREWYQYLLKCFLAGKKCCRKPPYGASDHGFQFYLRMLKSARDIESSCFASVAWMQIGLFTDSIRVNAHPRSLRRSLVAKWVEGIRLPSKVTWQYTQMRLREGRSPRRSRSRRCWVGLRSRLRRCRLSPLPRYSHALGQQEPISRRSRK